MGKHEKKPTQADVDAMTAEELERLRQVLRDEQDFPARSGNLEDEN
jgi:hypothetical protein